MALSLNKGESISLAKDGESLSLVRVGLGWDENPGNDDWDLDASAFGLTNGRVPTEDWVIYYKQKVAPRGAIEHTGDNLTGADTGNEDDETILVDVSRLPATIDTIAISVSIHLAEQRKQTFGQVRNAYVRIVDDATGKEIPGARYDLREDYAKATAVVVGELYRQGGEWRFRATGRPFNGNLAEICQFYGVDTN